MHPLAFLRFILGPRFTQQNLAERLGVTKSYVRAIENRQRQPSESLVNALLAAYGLNRSFLEHPVPDQGTPQFAVMACLLWMRVAEWKSRTACINHDTRKIFDHLFLPKLQHVLESASHKQRASAVLISLDRWIEETSRDFNLSPMNFPPFLVIESHEAYSRVAFNGRGPLREEDIRRRVIPVPPHLTTLADEHSLDLDLLFPPPPEEYRVSGFSGHQLFLPPASDEVEARLLREERSR